MLTALRRDARMLLDGLRGRRPPPVIANRRSPAYPAPLAADSAGRARTLEIAAVTRETADAVTLLLRDPAGLPLGFVPGQFLTVLVPTGAGGAPGDGAPLRRAYSISSSVLDPAAVSITVKRVPGGRASTYLVEEARAGMRLSVLGPSGEFTVAPDPAAARHVVAIAGGSGITPIMAIARAVIALEPASRVTLLYGNRDAGSIIFAGALDALAAESGGRLVIHHVLEDAAGRAGATAGRLDAATIGAHLGALAAAGALGDATFYSCGPEAMMAEARAALEARGVPAERIREERFSAPARRAEARPTAPQPVTIRRGGIALDVIVPAGATILDAGLAAGVPMALSCAMGGCGACAVRLTAGEVEMEEPNCLRPEERAGGKILACVARPLSPCTIEAAP